MGNPEAALIDVDGVLRVEGRAIPGAADAVERLRAMGLRLRFVTNTSNKSRATLLRQLLAMGFAIEDAELFTAPLAVVAYLRRRPGARIYPIVTGDVLDDFEGIPVDPDAATHVVVGGAEERFTYEAMNRAFRLLKGGAELLAIHKNTYWITEQGATLDAGAFVVGLEYAAGVRARLFGKPAPRLFREALRGTSGETWMVGDDERNDLVPARRLGLRTCLVLSGKATAGQADLVLDSIAALPDALAASARRGP